MDINNAFLILQSEQTSCPENGAHKFKNLKDYCTTND